MKIYEKYVKRPLDLFLSTAALGVLSPVLVVLTAAGAAAMKGNPFFTQDRPGRNEKIFKLIKFRTMTNEKDQDGNLMPDEARLVPYGRFLRKTSLDELPELLNILKGDMAIVGPRPLLVRYIPYYTEREHKRHSVRPGLTGLAQINGRNYSNWEQRFEFDLKYVNNISFVNDARIIGATIKKVIMREDILEYSSEVNFKDLDEERRIDHATN